MKHKYKSLLVESSNIPLEDFIYYSEEYKEINPIFNRQGSWQYTTRNGYSWFETDGKAFEYAKTKNKFDKSYRKFITRINLVEHMCFSKQQLNAIKTIAKSRLPSYRIYRQLADDIEHINIMRSISKDYSRSFRKYNNMQS